MVFFFMNLVTISVLSVAAVFLMLWLRRRIGTESLRRNHEVAGVVYSVVGAIFAVTVALIVDTVHDEYINADKNAATEAVQVAGLYQLAEWFPGDGEIRLKSQLKQYAQIVVEKEWKHALKNRATEPALPEAERAFQDVSKSVRMLEPLTLQQQTAYGETVQRLTALREARYYRLYGKRSELPFPLLFAVVFGGVVTIGFAMFFSMDSSRAQMAMIFFLSALIWSNVLVISQVQYPFNGIDVTPPRAFIAWLSRN